MTYDRVDDELPASLRGSARDFRVPVGGDLLRRVEGFHAWQETRRRDGYWSFGRSTATGPRAVSIVAEDTGPRLRGINFGSQDYLSLSSHPAVAAAAVDAIGRYGVHSAGSAALMGNTTESLRLEKELGAFLDLEHVTLFPTGYAAGSGAIRGLVRPDDHVLLDALAHACLQDGAAAATRNVYLHRHLDLASARRKLATIRARDAVNGVLVVTESLFSMDSDAPDIRALHAICKEFDATLMVDVAHDLGAMGPGGRGHLGLQDAFAHADVVMGSFSKTFASNGGFVASRSRAVKEYLRYFSPPATFSNALSPVQAAVVRCALGIVVSAEGDALRAAMMGNVLALRHGLAAARFDVYGSPSPIVAVEIGGEALSRIMGRHLARIGLVANLVEYPAVARNQARFRLQVMAKHTRDQVDGAVMAMGLALRLAVEDLAKMTKLEKLVRTAA